MSQTLFLVRLREVFRLREIYHVRVERIPAKALLATREAAEDYIATRLPLEHNPFARTNETLFVRTEDNMVYVDRYGGDAATTRSLDCFLFLERLAEAGIPPPDEWEREPKTWGLWWDVVTLDRTPEQKEELRRFLDLPDWSENPFALTSVLLDEDLQLTYAVPLTVLNALISSLGLEIPQIAEPQPGVWQELWAAENSLVRWWDETAPRMTDDQKAALWRLLDPQPWEIVEVELEGAP